MSNDPMPLGYTAAEARARGDEVPYAVPDCAEAWFYGWKVESKPWTGTMQFSMVADRPFWNWVTITGTIALDEVNK